MDVSTRARAHEHSRGTHLPSALFAQTIPLLGTGKQALPNYSRSSADAPVSAAAEPELSKYRLYPVRWLLLFTVLLLQVANAMVRIAMPCDPCIGGLIVSLASFPAPPFSLTARLVAAMNAYLSLCS